MISFELTKRFNGEGVYQAYHDDLDLAKADRYIHSIIITPAGGTIIYTFNSYLASLIHVALSFEVDTTFKRVFGSLNEWEIVIWYPAANRHELLCLYLPVVAFW
jgi:hypothetical protein